MPQKSMPQKPEARFEARLVSARQLTSSNQVLQAEVVYAGILKEWPECVEAGVLLARFAMERGDAMRAANLMERVRMQEPNEPQLAVNLALAYAHSNRPAAARNLLEQTIATSPDFHQAWLILGQLKNATGDTAGSNKALFQAVRRAQDKGLWLSEDTTPPHLLKTVLDAMERLRTWRRELFMGAFDALRIQFGADELKRVERALTGYLREWDATPADARQRPKFLYFPDIPSTPYLDIKLLPWAPKLIEAYPAIRAEAAQLISEKLPLPGFLTFKEGDRVEDYLTGSNAAWDAFFFYRHGKRFDDNHLRCPNTSRLLESIELCRIRDQAPEICFSVLAAGSHIVAHYGVTNARAVVHLPLIVPPDCALNIVDGPTHHWKEGEPMMFDDTFQHEAWNRSNQTRVILLMDVWNPHLSEVEKQAMKLLVESISDFEGEAKIS
jgi:aspartate beta-hydroxylase